MKRVLLPKLDISQIGEDVAGWFFEPSNRSTGGLEVIFQCPFNHRAGMKLHSIEQNGEVNASVLCHCGKYHEWVTLDKWPSSLQKKAGQAALPYKE